MIELDDFLKIPINFLDKYFHCEISRKICPKSGCDKRGKLVPREIIQGDL